jgi:hypothetical protein
MSALAAQAEPAARLAAPVVPGVPAAARPAEPVHLTAAVEVALPASV